MVNSKSNLHEKDITMGEKEKVPLNARGLHWSPPGGQVVSFAGGGRGWGRGRILVGGSLSHIAHHASARGLRKLL